MLDVMMKIHSILLIDIKLEIYLILMFIHIIVKLHLTLLVIYVMLKIYLIYIVLNIDIIDGELLHWMYFKLSDGESKIYIRLC